MRGGVLSRHSPWYAAGQGIISYGHEAQSLLHLRPDSAPDALPPAPAHQPVGLPLGLQRLHACRLPSGAARAPSPTPGRCAAPQTKGPGSNAPSGRTWHLAPPALRHLRCPSPSAPSGLRGCRRVLARGVALSHASCSRTWCARLDQAAGDVLRLEVALTQPQPTRVTRHAAALNPAKKSVLARWPSSGVERPSCPLAATLLMSETDAAQQSSGNFAPTDARVREIRPRGAKLIASCGISPASIFGCNLTHQLLDLARHSGTSCRAAPRPVPPKNSCAHAFHGFDDPRPGKKSLCETAKRATSSILIPPYAPIHARSLSRPAAQMMPQR